MVREFTLKRGIVAAFCGGVLMAGAGLAADTGGPAPEASPELAAKAVASFRDIPVLEQGFIDTAPGARGDGIQVGTLGPDGGDTAAIATLADELARGDHGNYDSLLIAHKNKLVFESYFKRGRINLAHPQASATKGMTALVLGRAVQMGYLSMADFDRPLIDFLDEIDRSGLADGAEKITLHKALTMHGGLNLADGVWEDLEKTPAALKGQGLVQALLENSGPITDETQVYRYGNFNALLVMAVIDAVVPGSAQAFIKTEVLDQLGISNYIWEDHISGLPQGGWMVSFTSRDMLKFGMVVESGGVWNGETLISSAFLEKAMSPLTDPTQDWVPAAYRYGYFWYHTPIAVGDKTYEATFAWGGGGQRLVVVEALDLVIAITAHDREDTIMDQIKAVVVPAFAP